MCNKLDINLNGLPTFASAIKSNWQHLVASFFLLASVGQEHSEFVVRVVVTVSHRDMTDIYFVFVLIISVFFSLFFGLLVCCFCFCCRSKPIAQRRVRAWGTDTDSCGPPGCRAASSTESKTEWESESESKSETQSESEADCDGDFDCDVGFQSRWRNGNA